VASLLNPGRPAGAPGIPIQFTGSVTKKGDGRWKIGDTPVAVAPETPGSDAGSVGATLAMTGLSAESIRILAHQPIVEFEDTLQAISPGLWTIDGHHVGVGDDADVFGDPQIGMLVECRALKLDDGSLLAIELRVGPPAPPTKKSGTIIQIQPEAGDAATWSVLLDQSEPDAYPYVAFVHVNGNTWVDQTRVVAETGQWFRLRGAATGANSYQADLLQVEHGAQAGNAMAITASKPLGFYAVPWSSPTTVAARLNNVEHSMVAFTGAGAAHTIWETDNRLYAAHQGPTGTWSTPEEIACGFAPYMIADGNGTLHVAFVNSFIGNFETYYVVWRGGNGRYRSICRTPTVTQRAPS